MLGTERVGSMRSQAVARSSTVGSLLRPQYLREARQALRDGTGSEDGLRAAEDRAVVEAIAMQEAAGLDMITDGEFRRPSWIATIPMRDDPSYHAPLSGFSFIAGDPGWLALWKAPDGTPLAPIAASRAFVTRPLRVERDIVTREFPFLKAKARARTKYTIPAPSWHRINWHPQYSRDAYATPEDFLLAVRDYLRDEVVLKLVALGCDCIQLDAPNYTQWHTDAGNRAAFAAAGHDLDAELAADAEIDNSVFDGITGVERAVHMCRGNAPGGRWLASGGYEQIAERLFPRLTNIDTLLLEYDTPRAGDFGPLKHVLPSTNIVLGLLTTKSGALEDAAAVEARIREAAQVVPLERLGLSPQCGFASGEAGNPLTHAEQEAKLRLIGRIARTVWAA